MVRKFSPIKLWKIGRILITTISIITIIFGLICFSNVGKTEKYAMAQYDEKCDNPQYDFQEEMCLFYLDMANDLTKRGIILVGTGLILLILFYGGTGFYRYVFPEVQEK